MTKINIESMRPVRFLLSVVVLLTGCEKTVVIDTEQVETKIVIEGLVTNREGYHYVKVSRSADFYDSGKTPRVTDAVVTVSDDEGNTVEFSHNPNNDPDSAGFYLPSTPFSGVIGRTYTLTVIADGDEYHAVDKMYSVTSIDSLTYDVDQDEYDDPDDPGKFYEVLIYAKEPQDTKDYYLFDFYRNDSLLVANPDEIYFSDDVALGEEINGVQSPIYYAKGDVARVEAFSLSRAGYVFYSDLQKLLSNDGGMYSPPPANCRTNLTNGALGFFRVSAVDIMEIKIE